MNTPWITVPMKSEVKFLSGGTPRKSESRFWNGDIPWVSSGEMTQRRISDTEHHVTEEGVENGTRLVPKNTVLVVVRGMSLAKEFRISLTERPVTFNQDLKALNPSSKIDPGFLYYYLHSQKNAIRDSATDASHGTKKLESRVLEDWPLPIPEISEQHAIRDILSAYDDLIENNRRRIHLLEQAARLLYKEWFVHLRFPGHEHVKIIDGVPEGWERKKVPELIEFNPKEPNIKGTQIRYIPMAGLSTSGMSVDLSESEFREQSTSVRFRNGDTLFARITPCLENGKTGFVNFLDEKEIACESTEFIVLQGIVVSRYLTYCLSRTHDFRETAIKSMIGSSGRQRVQPSCFDDYIVGLPSKIFLEQFDDHCQAIFTQIKNLSRQLRNLSKARDLLLPRLMNGEVAV